MIKKIAKAQLGSVVKSIGKAAKAVSKVAKSPAKKFGETGSYARLSDMKKSENYRAGKGYQDAAGDRDAANKLKLKLAAGAGAGYGAYKAGEKLMEKKKKGGTAIKKKC